MACGSETITNLNLSKYINVEDKRKYPIPLDMIHAFDVVSLLYKDCKDKDNNHNNLEKGECYIIDSPICEGIEINHRVYKMIDFVPEYNGIVLDSVIMKQVDGESCMSFSLTREDCKSFGIPFENGLELFPIKTKWKKVSKKKNIKDFDEKDLSTLTPSFIDGTIREIWLTIEGFKLVGNNLYTIDWCDGIPLSFNDIVRSIMVIKDKSLIRWRLVNQPRMDSKGRLWIALSLHREICLDDIKTSDGRIGIDINSLKGKSIHDLFGFYFYDSRMDKNKKTEAEKIAKQLIKLNEEIKIRQLYINKEYEQMISDFAKISQSQLFVKISQHRR